MPTTSKRVDKHKHLGAHEGTFCPLSPYLPYLSNPELHVQGGRIRYVKVLIGQPDFFPLIILTLSER